MKNLNSLVILFNLVLSFQAYSQIDQVDQIHTFLKGKVTDAGSGEPILFGNVALFQSGKLVTGSETDFDGNYFFSNIEPGVYNVEVSYVGYQTKQVTAIKVKREATNICNICIDESSTCCGGFIHYPPVIRHDDFTRGKTFSAQDIRRSPVK